MSLPPAPESSGTSTRPYLIRALHDWCTDNGFTPYLAVYVDRNVQVPLEYVKNNEIVLNVSFEATSGLSLGNDTIEFKARFGGVAREIIVPVDHVIAIYARENGQGMAFPVPTPGEAAEPDARPAGDPPGLRLAGTPSDVSDSGKADDSGDPRRSRDSGDDDRPPPPEPPAGGRPTLKRVK
ncbi:MAG: ClpXP protease specificity-enhancing factor [Aquabacterium sp.]|nr:ClpXP protease specificity-enhancing factor [Aquabacterium sp.]